MNNTHLNHSKSLQKAHTFQMLLPNKTSFDGASQVRIHIRINICMNSSKMQLLLQRYFKQQGNISIFVRTSPYLQVFSGDTTTFLMIM